VTAPAPVTVAASLPLAPVPTRKPVLAAAELPSTIAAPLNGHSHLPAAAAAIRLDLENDFDTAPGALEPMAHRSSQADEERTQPAPLRAGLPADSGFIEFDMSSLAGLSSRTPPDTERGRLEAIDDSSESPHAIKLSLARELKALGDVEGARSLVEEVAAESAGDLKAEAKQLLGQLR
jgi:pilus assembly protein FimV